MVVIHLAGNANVRYCFMILIHVAVRGGLTLSIAESKPNGFTWPIVDADAFQVVHCRQGYQNLLTEDARLNLASISSDAWRDPSVTPDHLKKTEN
jgi:hypothetical protein